MSMSKVSLGEEKQLLLYGTPDFIWSVTDIMGQGTTGAVYKGRHKVKAGNITPSVLFNAVLTAIKLTGTHCI